MASTAGRAALISAWAVVVVGLAAGAGYLQALGPPEGPPLVDGARGAPGAPDLPLLQPPPAHDQAPPEAAEGAPARPPEGDAQGAPEHAETEIPAPEHAEASTPPSLPQLAPPPVPAVAEAPDVEPLVPPHGTAAEPGAPAIPPLAAAPPEAAHAAPAPNAPEAAPDTPADPDAQAVTAWPATPPGLHGPMPLVERRPFDLSRPATPVAEPLPETVARPAQPAIEPTIEEDSHAVADATGHAPPLPEPTEPERAPDRGATPPPDTHAEPAPAAHDETPPATPHDESPLGETPVAAAAEPPAVTPPAHAEAAMSEQPAPPVRSSAVAVDGPMIAIVIGGLGLTSGATEAAIQDLPAEVTLSFSPYSGRLGDWVARARAAGHEVLLDLPMEPADFPRSDPGPQALMTTLDAAENLQRLNWVLSRSDAIVGVGSYMGSRFAADAVAMRPVLEAIHARGLIYLDTGQAAGGVVAAVGGEVGLTFLVSDMQVDRMAARQSIDDTLARVEATALRNGEAVAVGTAYPVTIERVAAWARSLGDHGIALAPISALAAR